MNNVLTLQNMFDPTEIIRGTRSSGWGSKEYGLYLANRPRKKLKGWHKSNKNSKHKKH
nr:MAG TPA: linker between RRM2 and RRM3 domains in RBM39 protein [Caudoviricetes sp.]